MKLGYDIAQKEQYQKILKEELRSEECKDKKKGKEWVTERKDKGEIKEKKEGEEEEEEEEEEKDDGVIEKKNDRVNYPELYTASAFKKQLDCQLVDIYSSLDSNTGSQMYYNNMIRSRTSSLKEILMKRNASDDRKGVKQVDREREWEREIEKERNRHREREKEMEKEIDRHREREKDGVKEIEMERNRLRDRARDRVKEVEEKIELQKKRERERREDRERDLEWQREKIIEQEIELQREKEKKVDIEMQKERKHLQQQNQKQSSGKGSVDSMRLIHLNYDKEHYSDIRLIDDYYSNSSDALSDINNNPSIDHTNINLVNRSTLTNEPNRMVSNALNFNSQMLAQPQPKFTSGYDLEPDSESASTGYHVCDDKASSDWDSSPPRGQGQDIGAGMGMERGTGAGMERGTRTWTGMGARDQDSVRPYSSTASSRSRSESRGHCTSPSPTQHTQHTQHALQNPNRGPDQPTYVRLARTYSKEESDIPPTRSTPSQMSDLDDRTVWAASPSSVGGSGLGDRAASPSSLGGSGMGDRARPLRTDSPSLIRRRGGSDGSNVSYSSYLGGTYMSDRPPYNYSVQHCTLLDSIIVACFSVFFLFADHFIYYSIHGTFVLKI